VHPPEVREARGIEPLPFVGRPAERFGSLTEIVLKQPGLRQSASNLDLIVSSKRRIFQRPNEEGSRLGSATLLQRLERLGV
jgi:hypothetical protein